MRSPVMMGFSLCHLTQCVTTLGTQPVPQESVIEPVLWRIQLEPIGHHQVDFLSFQPALLGTSKYKKSLERLLFIVFRIRLSWLFPRECIMLRVLATFPHFGDKNI